MHTLWLTPIIKFSNRLRQSLISNHVHCHNVKPPMSQPVPFWMDMLWSQRVISCTLVDVVLSRHQVVTHAQVCVMVCVEVSGERHTVPLASLCLSLSLGGTLLARLYGQTDTQIQLNWLQTSPSLQTVPSCSPKSRWEQIQVTDGGMETALRLCFYFTNQNLIHGFKCK